MGQVQINNDFVGHNHHSPSKDAHLRARGGPLSGPSHYFWEDQGLSSHLLDIMPLNG